MLFDFDDILIAPSFLSNINSRKEVNTFYSDGFLPLITAPMDTVISLDNKDIFQQNKVHVVLPRNVVCEDDVFISYGLDQFIEYFITTKRESNKPFKVLIDIANGHMLKLLETAELAKKIYGDNMILMVGNVANPVTFKLYCNINVDYVRIGIGNGGGCLTTVQTGIGYPMASLIESCHKIKIEKGTKTKIVADGGFKKYSDIIKALALGADYVMLGTIFNKALESAGETIRHTPNISVGMIIDQYSQETKDMFDAEIVLRKVFRGMSTKDVQKNWGKDDLVTSEGVVKSHKVEYTLSGWRKNFEDYLRSAMSYTGKKELHEFIGGVQYEMITQNAFKRFDK
jgi:IMP dehydrogenase/GMP reductase